MLGCLADVDLGQSFGISCVSVRPTEFWVIVASCSG